MRKKGIKVKLQLDGSNMGFHKFVTEDGQVIENLYFSDWGFKKTIYGMGPERVIQTLYIDMNAEDIVSEDDDDK